MPLGLEVKIECLVVCAEACDAAGLTKKDIFLRCYERAPRDSVRVFITDATHPSQALNLAGAGLPHLSTYPIYFTCLKEKGR